MKNIFLTGEVQIGKSTALKKIMKMLNLEYGGYLGHSLYSGKYNTIKLIEVKSLYNNNIYRLAKIDKVRNSIEVYRNSFEEKLAVDLKKSLKEREVIILDEIGRFEENFNEFKKSVYEVLDSEKLVLGVLKKYDGQFINSIRNRADTLVFEVNYDNRDIIPMKVMDNIKQIKLKEEDIYGKDR